ncbi:hypothetical protein KZY67_06245 [Prevotella melaninogenica]|mgnify:FL=1|jgi:hypothetical protein|uniref:Uncharacterized protein n=1 Tax=Prevotella melaninogenica TaxID=28132 RepID=A0A7D4L3K0_9BACT|nr:MULTISPECIES: hypothetical protein [Prevotella]EFC72498.1 hypothetical protein HMPREF0660_01882 [Prevotella melaninogenica D18]MBF1622787.1 hypothetical protein [Prevotella sp.]MBW4742205.1 hypothetical protein [Prevotella melaninogenica]MBW4912244.1 hypothetical protein [Prevotella melaninogenica]QKH89443.1 hypothetical protein FIU21_11145 [Prevotella melaninogenica]
MLQRDYFIRLIEEFNAAISRFLTKKDDELKRDKDLKDLYRQYVGEYDDLRNLSVDELLTYAKEQWKEEERIDKINMVAELLYAEGSYKGQPLRQILLEKAYALFDYVEANDSTFSIDRRQKMEAMRQELDNKLSQID